MAALETSEQKERAEAIYRAAQRFGTKSPFDTLKDVKTAVDYVNNAVSFYNQRKEKQRKAYIRKQAEQANIDFLIKTYKDAIKNGASHQEVIDNIQGIYKAKHNARIKEQIEALKAQML